MTRRSLFAMLLGLGAAPAVVVASRRPGSWFVEGIRYSSNVINIRDLQINPPLLLPDCETQFDPDIYLREGGTLRPFDLPPGIYTFGESICSV